VTVPETSEALVLGQDDIRRAAERIRGHVRHTPVLRLEPEATGLHVPVWLKLESQQVTGTFKARNAFSLLLGADVPEAGVVAVSGGNFGLAMAYAARRVGHPITVFVPAAAPQVKVDGIRALGARVEVVAGPMKGLFEASERRIEETGALAAHPFDQPEIVAGAGTCGMEFDEQCQELDTVLVAVGGGGLIAGIATWFTERARIVAVETHGTPTLHDAMEAGQPVEIEPSGIAVSALGAPRIGEIAWSVAQRHVDESLLVADDDATEAQRRLWHAARLVAEPGGAVALAALLSGTYTPDPDERVGVVLCGANTDPGTVAAT
jgi:threonine dehydratase